MDENNQLVLLNLNIGIPELWENDLSKHFPETSFIIQNASPLSKNTFSGLIRIENGDVSSICKFLKKNYPHVSIEPFYDGLNLFYYTDSNSLLANVLGETKCILNWPIKFENDSKKIRILLNEKNVENLTASIENKGMEILNFSKIRISGFNEMLTPKQKEILGPSLELGYYKFPKRINLNELSRELRISPSTLCVHLQKIESKILNVSYNNLFFDKLWV